MELLTGSVAIAERFFDFYNSKNDTFKQQFQLMMIGGIGFTLFSQIILIPIVFSVHKTNNRVPSLFGYIKQDQIHLL